MVELTNAQRKILASLAEAIDNNNLQTVQEIFNNHEDNDIQAVLSHKGSLNSYKDTILDFAISYLKREVEAQGEIGKSVEIIEQIWQKADQKTRDSVCYRAMDSFKSYPNEINSSNIEIYPDLKEVIEKVKKHKRVMALDHNLRKAIRSLDVEQVREALNGCGEDVKSVLKQKVYWNNSTDIDCLLIYLLAIDYKRNLGKEEFEKIKEITKLLWDKASPDVRDFWLEGHMVNGEVQNTGDNYIIYSLEEQQKKYANIAGEGWLEDLIKEVKDYRRQRDIKLNNDTTFWSEHKGKIALGATVVCTAGAVAAYVLAYPAVALALAVLAAVILMGAGIAKVLEDPSVEKPFQREVH